MRISDSYPVNATRARFVLSAACVTIGAVVRTARCSELVGDAVLVGVERESELNDHASFAVRCVGLMSGLRPSGRQALFCFAQDGIGKFAIIDDPRQGSRSDQGRERGDCVSSRGREVFGVPRHCERIYQFADTPRGGAARLSISPTQLTAKRGDRALAQTVVAPLARKIIFHVFQNRVFALFDGGFGRADEGVHVCGESFGDQLIFGREMTVEAPMRQSSGRHDLCQTGPENPIASKLPRGDLKDTPPRLRRFRPRFLHSTSPSCDALRLAVDPSCIY